MFLQVCKHSCFVCTARHLTELRKNALWVYVATDVMRCLKKKYFTFLRNKDNWIPIMAKLLKHRFENTLELPAYE